MKYVLTTGCSFTNNVRFNSNNPNIIDNGGRNSWPYFLQKELGDDCIVYNLGGATNDNVSMCRIIYYWIDKLVKSGIKHSDISVIIQWSDPNRESIYLKTETPIQNISQPHSLIYWDNWEAENGVFYLTGGFSPPDDTLEYFGIGNAVKYWELEVNWNNIINQTLKWLECWNHLILYFEKWGIKHNYMSMRNPFSYEAYEVFFGAPENNSDLPSKSLWFDKYEILKPYLKTLPIDTELYWHYKNYNGLLEWTIDNFKELNPFQETEDISYHDYLKIQPNGWGHPSDVMMELFVKTELINILKYK
jgi:hypothetical protein